MIRRLTIAMLMLPFAMPALAQSDDMVMAYGNASVNAGLTQVMNEAILNEAGQGATRASAPSVDARYRPDPVVRRKLADIMSKAAAKQGPGPEKEMRELVLSGEGVAQYQKVAPMLGYSANDAIDGLAFYMLAQWGVANDHRPDITRAQAAGVRRQAARAFAAVADQVNSNALRQEFGEMLMIQGAIMAGVHEAAVRSGDEEALDRYAAMARQGGEQIFQADPVAVALTDDGFRRR